MFHFAFYDILRSRSKDLSFTHLKLQIAYAEVFDPLVQISLQQDRTISYEVAGTENVYAQSGTIFNLMENLYQG